AILAGAEHISNVFNGDHDASTGDGSGEWHRTRDSAATGSRRTLGGQGGEDRDRGRGGGESEARRGRRRGPQAGCPSAGGRPPHGPRRPPAPGRRAARSGTRSRASAVSTRS